MKRIKILTLLISGLLVFNSCAEDLLEVDTQPTVSETDLQNLVINYPEKAYVLLSGLEVGNIRYLSDFGTLGNFHDDFGVNGYKLGLDFMSNDITMTTSNWFSSYVQYTARDESSVRTRAIWTYFYRVIKNMNDGLRLIPEGDVAQDIKFIKGRYLAMRADSYFNLIRIYANGPLGIPLILDDVEKAERV